MNRRQILKSILSAPLVYGLGEFLQGRPAVAGDDPPAWFRDALRKMKETGRGGVVLVAPAGEEDAKAFGRALLAQVESQDPRVLELFAEAVFICLTPELAAKWAPGEGGRRLLDPEGKVFAVDSVDAQTIDHAFASSFSAFLHGKDRERLRAVVSWRRASLSDEERVEIDRALVDVSSAFEESDAARAAILAAAARIVPALVLTALETREPRAAAWLFAQVRAAGEKEAGRVPFGSRLPLFREVCGFHEEIEKEDPEALAIACGMALPGENARRFLRVLTS